MRVAVVFCSLRLYFYYAQVSGRALRAHRLLSPRVCMARAASAAGGAAARQHVATRSAVLVAPQLATPAPRPARPKLALRASQGEECSGSLRTVRRRTIDTRCSAAATHASTCVAGSGQPVESVESHLWPNLTGAQLSYARSSILTGSLELLHLPTRHLRSYLLWVYLLRAGAAALGRAAQACAVTEPHA
eukprot:scaffold57640_cov74-Phaeocystis_antarctica.AAC.2